MATDFISREAAERVICEVCERPGCPRFWGHGCNRIDRLNKIPAADVQPVVRSEWEFRSTNDLASKAWTCPECGQRKVFKTNFCPKCGADMRKVVEIKEVKEDSNG